MFGDILSNREFGPKMIDANSEHPLKQLLSIDVMLSGTLMDSNPLFSNSDFPNDSIVVVEKLMLWRTEHPENVPVEIDVTVDGISTEANLTHPRKQDSCIDTICGGNFIHLSPHLENVRDSNVVIFEHSLKSIDSKLWQSVNA